MSRFRSRAKKEPVVEFEASLVQLSSAGVPRCLDDVERELAETGTTGSVEVTFHTVLNWGNRHDNEDRKMTGQGTHNSLSFHLIGVLDGHDTEAASQAVSTTLPKTLARHLRDGQPFEQAYTESMAECEQALKKQVPESASGPTKVTGLCWMSKDQKASTPEEVRRIRAAGGRVIDGRVEGLEPSRTLGDFDVKAAVPEGVISIVPEVRHCAIGDDGLPAQAVLICATDGVWDVITGQDICDLIHARREVAAVQVAMQAAPGKSGKTSIKPLQDVAEDLVQFAIARGSRDDCTAVVALVSVVKNDRA